MNTISFGAFACLCRENEMRRILKTGLVVAALVAAGAVHGAQRTFVSTAGVNNPACSLVAPCRDFGTAISATSTGGEVIVLDSGGYGKVTITQSVSIIAPPGVYAGISVFTGDDGVTVTAGVSDKVVLRGLTINGQGGNRGIVINAAGAIYIDGCAVSNMISDGVQVVGYTTLHMANSVVQGNSGNGVHLLTGTAKVHLDDVRISNNSVNGIFVESGALTLNRVQVENNGAVGLYTNTFTNGYTIGVLVRDSLFAGNGQEGVLGVSGAGFVRMAVERSAAMRNGGSGFAAASGVSFSTTTLILSNSVSTENAGAGLITSGTGTIASVGSSTLARNGGAGDLVQSGTSELRTHGDNALTGNGPGDIFGSLNPVGLK